MSSDARGLSHVNARVGTFVLVTGAVLVVGGFLAGRAQGWFDRTQTVRTRAIPLSPDSSIGLASGAEVQVLGTPVGSVQDVEVFEETTGDAPGLRMRFTMHLRGKMLDLVRTDSKVVVQRRFGVAGSAYVQITPGRGAMAGPDTQLECAVARDLTRALEESLDTINRPDGPLRRSLANLESVTSDLATGRGTAGALIHDPELARSLKATVADIEAMTAMMKRGEGLVGAALADRKGELDLKAIMASLRATTASLETLLGKADKADVGGLLEQVAGILKKMESALVEVTAATAMVRQQAKDLPALMAQTQEMMRQTTRTIEALQRSWLLRDNVQPDPAGARLTPADGLP